VRLWFTDTGGGGEPVVLMHAITGTSENWEPQIAALSKAGYRVIAFDRRGWGRSQADPATGPQPGHAADDLHALADFLSLQRFHLVGVAGGGFVALDYAAARPERLSSLVVAASTGSVSDKGVQDAIARIEIPGIRALPAHFREVGASYRAANPDGTKRWLEIEEHARQRDAPTQPLRSPNTFAKLATIATRTLVIAADADLIAPPALMKMWARHVKGAQWTTVPDAGHAIAWEQPAIFNDIVLRFLKGDRPFGDVPP
jgi:pimeloyl-ACP methyl ester carboxylesterase